MSKKKFKKAYKRALKNGYNFQEENTAPVCPAGMDGNGWGAALDPAKLGLFKNLPPALRSRQAQQFLIGALVGAAATYVLSNEELRSKIMKSALKLYSGVTGSFEEMKEQMADLQAEMAAREPHKE